MIYIAIESCAADNERRHEAGLKARNRLFALLGIDPAAAYKDERGKPRLDSGEGYSVSHSGGAALCAVKTDAVIESDDVMIIYESSPSHDIGADIELIPGDDRLPSLQRIARRFLHREADSVQDFCRLWTRAEAYGKLTGNGLADISAAPDPARQLYTFTVSFHGNDYVLSLCV